VSLLRIIATVLLLLASSPLTIAGEVKATGEVGVELREFWDDTGFDGQRGGVQPSFLAQSVLEWSGAGGRSLVRVAPFLRLDGWDNERTHFDLREAYWSRTWDEWELLAGVNTVFWGVTEARHLVNIINQIDFVEDIDREDLLGQPMLHAASQRSWGRVELFTLLGFREMTFPGREGRLRPPLPVDDDHAVFESGADEKRVDLAFRWSHFIGDWDVGAYLFHGTGREPTLVQPTPTSETLTPFYDVISQAGLDLQYTRNAWLYKLETIVREGQGKTFGAVVAGFEYTFYQVANSAADVGLLVEYLQDDRDETAPSTIFDDDIFVGTRLALNDTKDTAVLAGAIVDRHDGSIAALLEASRRLGEHFTLEIEARWFTNVTSDNALTVFQQDSYLMGRFSYHF
jgi:hypothetical protein